MEVAIFSDLHLDIKNAQEKWLNTAFDWVDSMVSTCKQKNIENIFFLGDWFNNRASVSGLAVNATRIILDKLKDFTLWIFPGNHDLYYSNKTDISSIALFSGHSNINYFDKLTRIELDGKSITLAPWGTNPFDGENSDFLFGHLEINTFAMNSASEKLCEDGLKLSDLLKKYKNIFSGHFHKAQKRVYSVGMVQYIGSPFQLNFGEANDEKGFIILDLQTEEYKFYKNNVSPKFKLLPLSKLIKTDFKDICKLCKNNYIRLVVDKSITIEDMNELTKLISSCEPGEYSIDWDNINTLVNPKEKLNFQSVDFIDTLKEYVELLEIDNQIEVMTYLNKVFKNINN